MCGARRIGRRLNRRLRFIRHPDPFSPPPVPHRPKQRQVASSLPYTVIWSYLFLRWPCRLRSASLPTGDRLADFRRRSKRRFADLCFLCDTQKMVRFRIDDPDIWKFDFDAAELKKKYLEERDKRLHDKRNDQWTWITPESKYWYLTKDPWVTPIERDAINEEVDVLVLGGGFSGIMTGQKLRDAGINSFKLIEKGGDFGGTWYW